VTGLFRTLADSTGGGGRRFRLCGAKPVSALNASPKWTRASRGDHCEPCDAAKSWTALGPGAEKRAAAVGWRISRHALVRLVQRSQAHDAVKLLSVMRVMAKAVLIALGDSDLIEDKPAA
jgi:hypothetical protein